MLGDATIATLEIGENLGLHTKEETFVLSKMEPRTDLQVGQRVGLSVDAAKAHLFDPATGENWVRPQAG
jgi:hypothetical protein